MSETPFTKIGESGIVLLSPETLGTQPLLASRPLKHLPARWAHFVPQLIKKELLMNMKKKPFPQAGPTVALSANSAKVDGHTKT